MKFVENLASKKTIRRHFVKSRERTGATHNPKATAVGLYISQKKRQRVILIYISLGIAYNVINGDRCGIMR